MELVLDVHTDIPEYGARRGDVFVVDTEDPDWPIALIRHFDRTRLDEKFPFDLTRLWCRTYECGSCPFTGVCPSSGKAPRVRPELSLVR